MMAEFQVHNAERTLRLIELLLAHPEGWTPQDLLIQLDLSRSSLFELLRAFKSLGYADQAGKRGRYVPGPRLLAWRAPQAPAAQNLLTAFYQEVEPGAGKPLDSLPSETLVLALPPAPAARGMDGSFVVVAQVESGSQVRSAYVTGQQVDGENCAAGQILRALPTPQTVINGYALVVTESAVELALPVCRDGHTPEAALLLTAPAFRWTPERLLEVYLEAMREVAAHLSYRLGAPFYAPFQAYARGGLSAEAARIEGLPAVSAMTQTEIGELLGRSWAASLACIRPDGKPHVIPVWQEWDGERFTILAWRGSQWADYVCLNPNVSLTVDEPWTPLRRVVVQGRAQVWETGRSDLSRLVQRMTLRYLGRQAVANIIEQVDRAFHIQPESLRGYRGLPVGHPAAGTTA
jgi:DNA-binding IclR family transcriptional regulator